MSKHLGHAGTFATQAWGTYPAGVCVTLAGPMGGSRGTVLIDAEAARVFAQQLLAAAAEADNLRDRT